MPNLAMCANTFQTIAYAYIHIYVYAHVHIQYMQHTHIYIHIHVYISAYLYERWCVFVRVRAHIQLDTHMRE